MQAAAHVGNVWEVMFHPTAPDFVLTASGKFGWFGVFCFGFVWFVVFRLFWFLVWYFRLNALQPSNGTSRRDGADVELWRVVGALQGLLWLNRRRSGDHVRLKE